jgi:hypothetical protein
MLSPLINVFFQLHVDYIIFSCDYSTGRLVHSINVVVHVQIHINIISIYYTVVHHVRILEENLSGNEHSYYVFI